MYCTSEGRSARFLDGRHHRVRGPDTIHLMRRDMQIYGFAYTYLYLYRFRCMYVQMCGPACPNKLHNEIILTARQQTRMCMATQDMNDL